MVDRLATTPSHVYAQSTYHCALCVNYRINNHNRNCVLLYYLFQENKSFGSKKPFAFILWCTGSCVEHSYYKSSCIFTRGRVLRYVQLNVIHRFQRVTPNIKLSPLPHAYIAPTYAVTWSPASITSVRWCTMYPVEEISIYKVK
jgi:hypothetical protein